MIHSSQLEASTACGLETPIDSGIICGRALHDVLFVRMLLNRAIRNLRQINCGVSHSFGFASKRREFEIDQTQRPLRTLPTIHSRPEAAGALREVHGAVERSAD